MKKIYFLFSLLFLCSSAWSICVSNKLSIIPEYNPGDECPLLCPQIYIKNPLSLGTAAECQQQWDKYFSQLKKDPNDYDANTILAIMLSNRTTGHAIDLKQAKIYAEKTKIQRLIDGISKKIEDTNSSEPITWCNNVAMITYEAVICTKIESQDLANKFQDNAQVFIAKLPPEQQLIYKKTIVNLFNFIKLDNMARSESRQFYGGTSESLRTFFSLKIMLNFYANSMNYFLYHYPENFRVNTSSENLDKQLNVAYQLLLQQVNSEKAKEMLIAAEKSWIKFRDSWIKFAQEYYSQRYTKSNTKEIVSAYLTKRRLEELQAETKDYQSAQEEISSEQEFEKNYMLKKHVNTQAPAQPEQ